MNLIKNVEHLNHVNTAAKQISNYYVFFHFFSYLHADILIACGGGGFSGKIPMRVLHSQAEIVNMGMGLFL